MNTLSWIVDGSFSTRLTVALLHFLWQGCAGGILVMVGGWLLRGAAARARYTLNVAAMFLMASCLPVTFFLLGSSELDTDRSVSVQNVHASPAIRLSPAVVPGTANEHPLPDRVDAVRSDESTVARIPVAELGRTSPDIRSTRDTLPVWPLSLSTMLIASVFPTLSRWVAALYLTGVALILGRLLRGVWGGHRLRKIANVVKDPVLLEMVRNQAHRLGLKVAPTIAWCEQISIPVVVGIAKPMILLPMAVVSGLTPSQLQALLLHELSHIRRFDPVVNLLQRIIEAMLFFHPVVWFVSRRISIERELAADDMVLAAGWDRPLYADALVRVAELAASISGPDAARRATVLGAAGTNPSEFKRRVLRLLDDSNPPKLDLSHAGILVTFLIVVMGGVFAWSQTDKQEKASELSDAADVNNAETIDTVTNPLPPQKVIAKELKPFQGSWAVTLCDSALKAYGAPQFEAQKWRWTIDGDEIIWRREGEQWKLSLHVDPSKSPTEIELTYLSGPFKGQKCQGMYEFGGVDGKTLQIAIQDPGAKVDRPKQIEMRGNGQTGLIFLRPAAPIDREKELASLQGAWTFTNVMTKAWPKPIGEKNDQVNERRWVVKGDEISWIGLDGVEVKLSFTIDPQEVPRHIDFTFLSGPSKGQKCKGVYEWSGGGGDLDICIADPGSNAERAKQIFYSGQATYSWITLDRFTPPANAPSPPGTAAEVERPVANVLEPFQGIWGVSLCDSETTDLNAPQEISRHMRWVIKGNEITWIRPGRGKSTLTFTVDPAKSPKEIDLTFLDGPHKDEKCLAMYEWGGIHKTSLNISMQDPGAKVARPRSISMTGGGQTSLIFLDPIDHEYELSLLQGRWSFKVESDAWPRPIDVEQERQWVVQGKMISWTNPKGEEVNASFTIDPATTPKQIDLTFLNGPDKGKTCRGIYDQIALAKKPLWLCLTDPGSDTTRPTEFTYEAAAGRSLIRLAPNHPPVPHTPTDPKSKAGVEPAPALAKERELFQRSWKFDTCWSETWRAELDEIRHWRWTVKGDQITWTGPEGEAWKLSFTIDPAKSPKQFDFTFLDGPHKGETCASIYTTEGKGQEMWICLQDPGTPTARPVDFPGNLAEIRNTGRSLFILRPVEPNSVEKELASLQGSWLLSNLQTQGWPKPIGKGPDKTGQGSEWKWSVKENEITWTSPEGEEIKLSFTIDPTKSPKHFDVTFLNGPDKGKKRLGLYERGGMHGKSLWLCLTDPGSKADRPTDLSFSSYQGRSLMILHPIKPATTTVSQDSTGAKPSVESGEPFQSTWAVESCESKAAKLNVSKSDARRWRWSIKGDEITWGREGQEWRMNFKIDPAKTPKLIDFTFLDGPHKGETCLGIYERSGDDGKNLRIRFQDPGAKVGRPTSFAMPAESQTSLMALRSIPPIDPAKELAWFQGTWSWDYSQVWTWPQPIGLGFDGDGRKSEKRWVIEGNRITWVGRDGERIYVTFTIDPFKAPKQIEFTFLNGPHGGHKSIGIYESKGDEDYLDLCMTDPGTDAPRPTDISAGTFKQQSILAIHRVAPPAKPSAANELKRLQGVWKMTLCDSTLRTFGATQKEIENWQWTIKGDEILWRRGSDEWKLKLEIAPPKYPRETDLTYLAAPFELDLTYLTGAFKGAKCKGIFGWGGVGRHDLMIAIQDPGSDAQRPTKFHMNSAVKTGLMILSPSQPNDIEREITALQGTWTLRNFDTGNFERNKDPSSWPLPGGKGPDKSGEGSELRWTVKGNEITWVNPSGAEIKASFTIDLSKSPKQIDLTFLNGSDKGKTCPGIYQRGDLDENILWICVADPASTKVRPKEFSYGWNEGRSLLSFYPLEPSTAAGADVRQKP